MPCPPVGICSGIRSATGAVRLRHVTLNTADLNRVRNPDPQSTRSAQCLQQALYDATSEALLSAANDPDVAVVMITGRPGLQRRPGSQRDAGPHRTDPGFVPRQARFSRIDRRAQPLPKPLICAVNGIGLGIGTTILGYADLAFMSTAARLKCRSPAWVWHPRQRRHTCCRSWSGAKMRRLPMSSGG